MNNLNSVLLEGNLCRDPELRYTPKGTPVCTLVVASNRSYKVEGERHEEVSFVEATTWGKLATVCAEHLAKGRGVRVVGRQKQERWEDGDGNTRAKIVIVAEHVEFQPRRRAAGGGRGSRRRAGRGRPPSWHRNRAVGQGGSGQYPAAGGWRGGANRARRPRPAALPLPGSLASEPMFYFDPMRVRPSFLVRCCWIAALGALLMPMVAGCAASPEERTAGATPAPTSIGPCVAVDRELAATATLVRGAGRYHLVLVAAGAGTQRSVAGALELTENEPPLRRLAPTGVRADDAVLAPLYGWAAIDLAAVDAVEMGDIGSRDPLRPGVLVLEQRPAGAAPVAITLRFGSIANRRDGKAAVDGGYFALHVAHVDPHGSFAGSWVSGVHARRVSGHFCATLLR